MPASTRPSLPLSTSQRASLAAPGDVEAAVVVEGSRHSADDPAKPPGTGIRIPSLYPTQYSFTWPSYAAPARRLRTTRRPSEAEQGVEPDGQARPGGTCFIARSTPGMKEARSMRIVADRQRLAGRAEKDFLVGDQAPQAHRMDMHSRRASVPRRSARRSSCRAPQLGRRLGLHGLGNTLRVNIAVPEGASSLPSWCSSTISAVSKKGAANSAKRIMSTAPMAKLGATTQLASLASKTGLISASTAGANRSSR